MPFVDTDHALEARLGCSIREFFEREGESRFRDMESEAIDQLTAGHDKVLSTGGGSVLRPQNREWLKGRCQVIYLKSTPEDLYRRLRNDTHRPLLQVADPMGRLRDLHAERDALYRAVAHFVLETGRPSVSTLVNMIIMQLEMVGVLGRAPEAKTSPHYEQR